MKAIAIKQILQKTPMWVHRTWFAHGIFWLTLLVILVLSDFGNVGWPMVLYQKSVDVLFYVILIYINLLYLIPTYLSRKKFWSYVGFLMLSVIVLTPIKVAFQVFLFSEQPSVQNYFLENQIWYYFSMFLVGSSSTIYGIISDWFIHQSEKMELQTKTMQSELKFLRSQINPHFLFNTLNNLYALTLKKSDDAPEIVLKLSEMMRYMLYECNERKVPLYKEVTYMKNYLDLERLRQHKMIDIKMDITGDVSDQRIAPLLLIPFIENSFKHGLSNEIDHGFVNISLKINGNHLIFEIVNSKGPSQPKQTHRRSGGIGLVNVRRRLNLIYDEAYKLEIKNDPNQYKVKLDLTL